MVRKAYIAANVEVITDKDYQAASDIRQEHSVINFIARLGALPSRN